MILVDVIMVVAAAVDTDLLLLPSAIIIEERKDHRLHFTNQISTAVPLEGTIIIPTTTVTGVVVPGLYHEVCRQDRVVAVAVAAIRLRVLRHHHLQ